MQQYDIPVKRCCQTLDLHDSSELIAEYRKAKAEVWSEILVGSRQVGVVEMEIYNFEHVTVYGRRNPTGIRLEYSNETT